MKYNFICSLEDEIPEEILNDSDCTIVYIEDLPEDSIYKIMYENKLENND